ncbi:hypothetical protein EI94DRAFT_862845 [Lactarius quietus]|nr:hypothetical protein EI94DRAFT_862845 [Lactarius quietus]
MYVYPRRQWAWSFASSYQATHFLIVCLAHTAKARTLEQAGKSPESPSPRSGCISRVTTNDAKVWSRTKTDLQIEVMIGLTFNIYNERKVQYNTNRSPQRSDE